MKAGGVGAAIPPPLGAGSAMAGTREAGATRPRASPGPAGLPGPRPAGVGEGARVATAEQSLLPSPGSRPSRPAPLAPVADAVVCPAVMQRAPGTGWRKMRVL